MNVRIDYLAMGFNFICDRIIFVTTMAEVKFQAIPQRQRKDYSTRKSGALRRDQHHSTDLCLRYQNMYFDPQCPIYVTRLSASPYASRSFCHCAHFFITERQKIMTKAKFPTISVLANIRESIKFILAQKENPISQTCWNASHFLWWSRCGRGTRLHNLAMDSNITPLK